MFTRRIFDPYAFFASTEIGYTILMATVFIDYTRLYYSAIATVEVPLAISGKFVRIRNESTDYLVFSPKEFTKYHANIVERFCFDKGIEGGYDPERKRYDILDQAWVISGGGKYQIDKKGKVIRLYDESMAYGKFELPGLRETLLGVPELTGFTVMIE
jgi:hypothetical protein